MKLGKTCYFLFILCLGLVVSPVRDSFAVGPAAKSGTVNKSSDTTLNQNSDLPSLDPVSDDPLPVPVPVEPIKLKEFAEVSTNSGSLHAAIEQACDLADEMVAKLAERMHCERKNPSGEDAEVSALVYLSSDAQEMVGKRSPRAQALEDDWVETYQLAGYIRAPAPGKTYNNKVRCTSAPVICINPQVVNPNPVPGDDLEPSDPVSKQSAVQKKGK